MTNLSLNNSQNTVPDLEEMPITKHLVILRRHLIKITGLILILFFCLLPFANQSYQLMSEPLRAQLPMTSSMIATDVTATFMAPFKLNFFVALMLAMPFVIYQLWAFIKPALYEKSGIWRCPYYSAASSSSMSVLPLPIGLPCHPSYIFL